MRDRRIAAALRIRPSQSRRSADGSIHSIAARKAMTESRSRSGPANSSSVLRLLDPGEARVPVAFRRTDEHCDNRASRSRICSNCRASSGRAAVVQTNRGDRGIPRLSQTGESDKLPGERLQSSAGFTVRRICGGDIAEQLACVGFRKPERLAIQYQPKRQDTAPKVGFLLLDPPAI
jgi:hypothetical protein